MSLSLCCSSLIAPSLAIIAFFFLKCHSRPRPVSAVDHDHGHNRAGDGSTAGMLRCALVLGLASLSHAAALPPAGHPPQSGIRPDVPGCRGIGLSGLDVTIPFSPTVGERVAIFYSFVPWILALVWVVMSVVFRTTQLLLGVVWAGVVVLLNEAVWKKVLSQSRPTGSCLHSKGMPSTHSELALGMFVWLGLELMFHRRHWPEERRIGSVIGLAVLLLPVLPSRQVLCDHSAAQVLVGGVIGAVFGAGYFAVLHYRGAAWLSSLQLHPFSQLDYVHAAPHPVGPPHPGGAGAGEGAAGTGGGAIESDATSVSSAASHWVYDDYAGNALQTYGGTLSRSHSEGELLNATRFRGGGGGRAHGMTAGAARWRPAA